MFGPLHESVRIPSQKISWISYTEQRSRLLAQSPEIITETYGITREGPVYATDKPSVLYKLPFCHAWKQCPDEVDYSKFEALYNKLQEIDALCGADAFRVKMPAEKNAQHASIIQLPASEKTTPTALKTRSTCTTSPPPPKKKDSEGLGAIVFL